MNRTPSILVDTGFEVDQNGVLTEIVIPNVVTTLNAPRKITFEGQTLNHIPSTAAALQEFNAPNCTAINGNLFNSYTALKSVSIPKIASLGGSTSGNIFRYCSAMQSINLDGLVGVSDYANSAVLSDSPYITSLSLPSLKTVSSTNYAGGIFYNLTGLTTVTAPSISQVTATSSNGGFFKNCTALTSVQLGSVGNPVVSLGAYTFNGSTQAGLTITVYTTGGASIANEPWGATNATIEYEEA